MENKEIATIERHTSMHPKDRAGPRDTTKGTSEFVSDLFAPFAFTEERTLQKADQERGAAVWRAASELQSINGVSPRVIGEQSAKNSFDKPAENEILVKQSVPSNPNVMPLPNGDVNLDADTVAVGVGDNDARPSTSSTNVAESASEAVATLLCELSVVRAKLDASVAECGKLQGIVVSQSQSIIRLEADLVQSQHSFKLAEVEINQLRQRTVKAADTVVQLKGENSRLRVRRAAVRSKAPDGVDDARCLALAAKLISLKHDGSLVDYSPSAVGRNAKHPDFWVRDALQPFVNAGLLTTAELVLAMQEPTVWFRVDPKLYNVKSKRNLRASPSQPLRDAMQALPTPLPQAATKGSHQRGYLVAN